MRRVGSTPQQRGSITGETCPDVIELEDNGDVFFPFKKGDFLVIGTFALAGMDRIAIDAKLSEVGASIGLRETAVVVPRKCIIDAAREILRGEDIN